LIDLQITSLLFRRPWPGLR